jgi:hypothetical protein
MKEKSRCSILFHLLVPGGRVADHDVEAEFVGQLLQLAFPQPHPRAVAAAAVGGDQQSGRVGVTRPTDVEPPLADAVDRKACPWQRTGGVSWSTPTLTHPEFAARS